MARPRVYISRKLPEEAVAIVAKGCDYVMWPQATVPVSRSELTQQLGQSDGALVLVADPVDAEMLAQAGPRCKVLANMGVGVDNIDVKACTERGILVTNTPDVLTETTADLVFALMMATARRLYEGQRLIAEDRWRTWSPLFMCGQDVYGATLGIIGAGRIGSAVARRAKGFGMRILYHNRQSSAALEEEVGAELRSMEELLSAADFVVTLLPLTAQSKGLMGELQFRLMKPTAVFVNAARGAIVQEAALYRALREGWIWAAGLDVFEREPINRLHPLLQLPNVTAVPHIGSATVRTRIRMATLAAENLVAAVNGKLPPTPVNPEVRAKALP